MMAKGYRTTSQSLDIAQLVTSVHGSRYLAARIFNRDGTTKSIFQKDNEEENAFKTRIVKGIQIQAVDHYCFETLIAQPDFEELGIS